jgi:predicted dehydrogenase
VTPVQPLGVGIIGAGAVTQAIHLPALATLSDRLRVAHVFDVDAATAAEVASRVGARGGTSLDELFADPEVDVVAICSPHQFHADQIEAACAAGKRGILCEKPLAMTVAEAERIAKATSASGVPLIVGAMHAWDPAFRAAADAWGDLPDTVRAVRSTIYLPKNSDMTTLATDLFVPAGPARPTSVPAAPLEAELGKISSGVFGLATHATPLIRRLVPGISAVRHARGLKPWGYSINYEDGERSVSLVALLGGAWAPHWTLDAWGDTTELHVSFPPSYVMTGSSEATLRGSGGSRTWRFDRNGYQMEWLHLADVVDARTPLAVPATAAVEDLRHAVALADAAVAERRRAAGVAA